MSVHSWTDIMFSLVGLLSAGLMVVAGVVAVLSLRSLASVVLLVGTILGLISNLGWMVFSFTQRGEPFESIETIIMGMRIFGTFSWLVTAAGVLLLVFTASGLRRQNQALESIMAGSQTDRVG